MEIQIDPHTLERAEERGTNEGEIKDVIQEKPKGVRSDKSKVLQSQ